MSWPPEMEVIGQLLGGDLPLPIVCHLLGGDERARQVLGHYINKGAVVFAEHDRPIPLWQSRDLLRALEPLEERNDILVSLTDFGAKAFGSGAWDTI